MLPSYTVVKFDGFLTLYQEGEDDIVGDEEGRRLPEMSAGERLAKRLLAILQLLALGESRFLVGSLVDQPILPFAGIAVVADRGVERHVAAEAAFGEKSTFQASAYFNLPPGRVVELGMQVEL